MLIVKLTRFQCVLLPINNLLLYLTDDIETNTLNALYYTLYLSNNAFMA